MRIGSKDTEQCFLVLADTVKRVLLFNPTFNEITGIKWEITGRPAATCALGAIALAFNWLVPGGAIPTFHELGNTPAMECPLGCSEDIRPIEGTIVHLNDDHRWSRECIADWLETL